MLWTVEKWSGEAGAGGSISSVFYVQHVRERSALLRVEPVSSHSCWQCTWRARVHSAWWCTLTTVLKCEPTRGKRESTGAGQMGLSVACGCEVPYNIYKCYSGEKYLRIQLPNCKYAVNQKSFPSPTFSFVHSWLLTLSPVGHCPALDKHLCIHFPLRSLEGSPMPSKRATAGFVLFCFFSLKWFLPSSCLIAPYEKSTNIACPCSLLSFSTRNEKQFLRLNLLLF